MNYNTFLIVHIGGASISGLAELLHKDGKKIYGWEKRIQNENVQRLIKNGIKIFSEEIPINILNTIDCIVHSSITSSDYIRDFFGFESNKPIFTQFKFINLLIKDSKSIAITGSYGKTITTTLLSHTLDTNHFDVSYTCGGVSKNFNSNAKKGESNIWVVEAVETHENCLHLSYSYGIILNVESQNQIPIFEKFIENAQSNVFINSDDVYCKEIMKNHPNNIVTFGINDSFADFHAINIRYLQNFLTLDIVWKQQKLDCVNIPYNGFFSIYNVLAVIAISTYLGINIDILNKSFSTYLGVQKRFDFVFKSSKVSFVTDIAHHPVSIKEVLKQCKHVYDEIIVLYRPHMFKELNQDALATIDAFERADKIVLLHIESVKDKLENGIDAKEFVSLQKAKNTKWFYFDTHLELLDWLMNIKFSNTLILQMGMYIETELTNKILNIL